MTLLEIARFEVAHRFRQPSTWLYALVLFVPPFLIVHLVDGGASHVNAPGGVASFAVLFGILGGLVTAALFADAGTRDFATRMDSLFHTAPIRKVDYLGGRFLGALAVNVILLTGIPLGLAAASMMPYHDPAAFGPFRLAAYGQPFLFFLLPNLLTVAALLFALAALSRQSLPAYLGGVGLSLGYVVANVLPGTASNRTLAMLLDPFGAVMLNELMAYWTPVEHNVRLFGTPAILLWNRALWLGVAALLLAVLFVRFRTSQPRAAGSRRGAVPSPAEARSALPPAPVAVPRTRGEVGAAVRARQVVAVTRRSVSEALANRAFVGILLGAVGWVFLFGWEAGGSVYGTTTLPVTRLIAGSVLSGTPVISLVILLLIALYAGELVWRERDVAISDLADATPIPDWVPLAGKFLALVAVIVSVQLALLAAGVALQALQGYFHFELGLYLKILLGLNLLDYLLMAALAMLVHVVVDQKHLGHVVVVMIALFLHFADEFGIQHNLLKYGGAPGWLYSDLTGFGPSLAPFLWFKLFWLAWALLFVLAAKLLWVRGRERGAGRRLQLARARLTRPALGFGAVGVMLILAVGGFVFLNTNVRNAYGTERTGWEWAAEYERLFKRYETLAQPQIAAVELHVEVHPEERALDVRGSYWLVNRTATPISSIHLLHHEEVQTRAVRFSRPARLALRDSVHRYSIFGLDEPLAPGDSLRMSFDLAVRPSGFKNSGASAAIASDALYIDRLWFPVIGYQPVLELQGADERAEVGLGPRAPVPTPDDLAARRHSFAARDAGWVRFEAIIGTRAGQTALTAGTLVRRWTERGRDYAHFRADAPIANLFPILTGEFAVRRDRWRGVELEVFHHPAHDANVDRMLRAMEASLDFHAESFGPYPHRTLRIVEFPLPIGGFARAHPTTITFSEGSSFLTRVDEGELDRPFFVTAHEVAHQWWGNQVAPASVQGGALLTETLAQYGALMTMERTYGRERVRDFLAFERDDYLSGRGVYSNREVPLVRANDQPYLFYDKGALAMYTLGEYLGESRVNAALRAFLEEFRFAGPPYATSTDLLDHLRAVTPDSLRPLLSDLFEDIVLWEMRIGEPRVSAAGGDGYRVTFEVEAVKLRADSVGNETEIPMDDLVEIGIFPAEPAEGAGDTAAEPLYLRRHRIRSGRQTLTVTVPRRPGEVAVDPYRLLIERLPDDNRRAVAAADSASTAPQ